MDNPYEQEQQRVLSRIVTTLEKLNESVLALNHAVAVSNASAPFSFPFPLLLPRSRVSVSENLPVSPPPSPLVSLVLWHDAT